MKIAPPRTRPASRRQEAAAEFGMADLKIGHYTSYEKQLSTKEGKWQ
jgi:hypothetical protein